MGKGKLMRLITTSTIFLTAIEVQQLHENKILWGRGNTIRVEANQGMHGLFDPHGNSMPLIEMNHVCHWYRSGEKATLGSDCNFLFRSLYNARYDDKSVLINVEYPSERVWIKLKFTTDLWSLLYRSIRKVGIARLHGPLTLQEKYVHEKFGSQRGHSMKCRSTFLPMGK